MFERVESGVSFVASRTTRNDDPQRPMTNQDDDVGREFRVGAYFAALPRVWELWRRVARDVIVVVRHVVLYLVSRLRGRRIVLRRTRRQAVLPRGRATAAQHAR